jgi:hypothetical protein
MPAKPIAPWRRNFPMLAGNFWQLFCQPWHCYLAASVMQCWSGGMRYTKRLQNCEFAGRKDWFKRYKK